MRFKDYFHIPAITAGFIAVLVGYTGSAVIVFQAAQAAGADASQIGSWMMALGIGMGISSLGLSWYYKMPIVTAWSTPGAALLVTSLDGVSLAQATGAFLFSAALVILVGITGWFARIMDRIPLSIASAMLAGILFQFGIDAFVALESRFELVMIMFLTYIGAKALYPRYAVLLVLIVGIALSEIQGLLDFSGFGVTIGSLTWVQPEFSIATLISVGIPLFIVTMASQNIPGVVVLRASGYSPPVSSSISWTGVATLLLAPFGGFAINLAALTASICAGPEAHEDPQRRYLAGISNGICYLILGLFGATVAGLIAIFPAEFVLALAGLALLGTIATSLHGAMADQGSREAAIITFLVTASGINLFGIGAAFWGLVGGALALMLSWKRIYASH